MRTGDLVAVVWVDSVVLRGTAWVDPDELTNELPRITTLGCVHQIDRSAVTLFSSWCQDEEVGEVGGVITIPRKAIVAVAILDIELTEV